MQERPGAPASGQAEMDNDDKILIYGAGGHARELMAHVEAITRAGGPRLVGFVEDGAPPGSKLCGQAVMDWEVLTRQFARYPVAVAIGDPGGRRIVARRCADVGHTFPALVHPSVDVSGVALSEGVVIFRGSVLTVDIRLGKHVHVNIGCTISHDAVLDDFCTVSPGVRIAGNVHVGEGVFIGVGATIINGSSAQPLRIGEGSVIAAGACVVANVDAGCMYAGVPARKKKAL